MTRNAAALHFNLEEILNAVTHGVGAFLALIGLGVLTAAAYLAGGVWHVVSFSIYGTSLVLLYVASTLYHSFTNEKLKYIFKFLDHAAIYVLIAGNYTPFTLIPLHGTLGWTMFFVIWGLAVAGIIFQIFFVRRFKVFATICYLFMGWLAVVMINPLLATLPIEGIYWLIGGGLFYTVGAIFYLAHKIPYNHAIWHLFVLAGSIAHYIAVLRYVLPIPVMG
ncbi:PAQR family membrane homeostasis protein TrhA [Sporomusa acidovorans]|uniref:Hemolysin-III related n=1 Tax=Sporomusa acidovorans (strain ATCC 49682 / DSM 3132 / Mol) TaxID=1123286 RepID=A0ABZ3IZM2_SPOA4|nr:hemolysin III family protein [Sporomusa acidovorans]OZC14111.1 hemolysin-III related [Sporomusa acidovorans DSM 3132]SDE68560.1 hemolysin III [Sporomusa acidovorans]